jgi:hypothetical protein
MTWQTVTLIGIIVFGSILLIGIVTWLVTVILMATKGD